MKRSRGTSAIICVLGLVLPALPASAQDLTPDPEGFIIAGPADLIPPDGARRIAILGDPNEPGPYVIRITFEPGQGSRPHFHDQARYITVIEGTWWVASGARADVYEPDSMRPVPAGSFLYQPPNGHHYDMAKDEAVTVQIMGMGPVRTTSIPEG
jgi:quercetin dioxygenase-like cupin family protein